MNYGFDVSGSFLLNTGDSLLQGYMDDAMHTHLGVFEKVWLSITQGTGDARLLSVEQVNLVDRRSEVFPFTKKQSNLTQLGTSIPKKSRDRLTAMVPLLI